MLTPTATIVYVDGQLLLKANRSTTYTTTEVDTIAAAKLDASALAGYYTKSFVDTALASKQPLTTMIKPLSVDTITGAGAITAAGNSTTGTANFGSMNTDILYVSTMMQSAGSISVGT